MPSTPALDISSAYAASSPSAQDKVPASTLDSDHRAIEAWTALLLASLSKIQRDDDTLVDGVVRNRNLHPEVMDALAGVSYLEAADVTSTTNITLSGLQTIDSYTLIAGNRVLANGQTDSTQNGVYVAAAGAWSRASDLPSAALTTTVLVIDVVNGTANAGSRWQLAKGLTVGGSPLNWTKLSGLSSIVSISKGGTSATTAAAARSNLGVIDPSAAMTPVVTAADLSAATIALLGKRQSGRVNMAMTTFGDVLAIGGQSATTSFARGLQIGGGDPTEGPDGTIDTLEGHSTWRGFWPSRNLSSIEFALHPTAATGQAVTVNGTNQLNFIQGTAFNAAWIGKKIYFNETIYRVSTVSGSSLTVTYPDLSPVVFVGAVTEVFQVSYVYGSGTCNVNGTLVTRTGGDPFVLYITNPSFNLKVNGSAVTAAAWLSTSQYTLSSAPGNATGVPYEFWFDVNEQISTFRLHKTDSDAENLSIYSRYDGYWIAAQYGSFGKYRSIRISSGEYAAGAPNSQVTVHKNGDLSLGGDYTRDALRIVAQGGARANFLTLQAATTGIAPALRASGSDANVPFGVDAQGVGGFVVTNGTFARTVFKANAGAGTTSWLEVDASSTDTPSMAARGANANIDLTISPKGTGLVRLGTWTTNADAAVNGYITIKDSAGNTRKLATIA